MAKRRRASSAQIVRVPTPVFQRQPAQVIQIRSSRASTPRKPKRHHRRRSSSSGGAVSPKSILGVAIGGAIFGFVEKQFPGLPTLPVIGRAGTIAVVGYFLCKSRFGGSIVRDLTIAAAAIAGQELGSTGHISGDLPSQVRGSGMASQV